MDVSMSASPKGSMSGIQPVCAQASPRQLCQSRGRSGGRRDGPRAYSSAKQPSKRQKRKQKQKHHVPEPGTAEDVIFREVEELLGKHVVDAAVAVEEEWRAPFEMREEAEVVVACMSSSGRSRTCQSAKVCARPDTCPTSPVRTCADERVL